MQFNFALLLFFVLGPMLLLIKSKITVLFQAEKFRLLLSHLEVSFLPVQWMQSLRSFVIFPQPNSGTKYY